MGGSISNSHKIYSEDHVYKSQSPKEYKYQSGFIRFFVHNHRESKYLNNSSVDVDEKETEEFNSKNRKESLTDETTAQRREAIADLSYTRSSQLDETRCEIR
jgi:hypothetical protein